MEPHITLQHVFVGGKLTQTDRFLASHRLEGTLVLIEMMARLLQTAQVFTEESLRKIEVVSADSIQ